MFEQGLPLKGHPMVPVISLYFNDLLAYPDDTGVLRTTTLVLPGC